MPYTLSGTLQAATTIAKTTQTIIGSVLNVQGMSYITLYLAYTKGDETGLLVQGHIMPSAAGAVFQECAWTAASGTKTSAVNQYSFTATANRYITFDVRGIHWIKFTQGGSNNDGTPTGTLAASYTIEG